ncbi:MAG TPA: MBL fold metallo-hydrolase [Longimicrobiales bacterium]|nr:MBL fold metallo-hydrolase [Longimicrobiales bacterium]
MSTPPRMVLAPNPSPMTLDGTRTFIVGTRTAVIIDPGPDLPDHLERVAAAVRDALTVTVVITHYHPDHASGAAALGRRLRAPVRGSIGPGRLSEGDVLPTDGGELHVLETPGHAREHLAFHWPDAGAIFCGDLMMGGLDTALVAAPEGNLTAYLESLGRLRRLAPRVIYPTHGPEFADPDPALARYLEHRVAREVQVLEALAAGARGVAEVAGHVYGNQLEPELRQWVEGTTRAYLEHLERSGRIDGAWRSASARP